MADPMPVALALDALASACTPVERARLLKARDDTRELAERTLSAAILQGAVTAIDRLVPRG